MNNDKDLQQPTGTDDMVQEAPMEIREQCGSLPADAETKEEATPIGRKESVRLRRSGKSVVVKEDRKGTGDTDVTKILTDALAVSSMGGHVAVVIYQDCILSDAEDVPFGNDSPSIVLFLDRFNEDTVNHPIWQTLGVDIEGMFDILPVHSPHLITALMNRMGLEAIYEEMQECRKQKVASIYEGQYPALRHLLNRQADLPTLTVIIQSPRGTFRYMALDKVMVLNQALMEAGIWPKGLFNVSDDEENSEPESESTEAPASQE